MRVTNRPDLWRRLCELAGLDESVSVDVLHKAYPTVGRGTIQRIGAGGSPQMGSLQRIADQLGLPIKQIVDGPSSRDDPTNERPRTSSVSQVLRHEPFETPPTITWESTLTNKELPPRFCLAVPDDALAPRTPRGTVLIFDRSARPHPGDGVLIEDAHGGRHIRRFLPGVGGQWSAGAHNDAYPELQAERDGLRILAAATGRMSGSV